MIVINGLIDEKNMPYPIEYIIENGIHKTIIIGEIKFSFTDHILSLRK
jgi:hypothetical protein